MVDEVLNDLKDTKGIIIDVRGNPGGQPDIATMVPKHFTTEKVFAGYKATPFKVTPATGHHMVKLSINGVEGKFILDTGAANSIFDNNAVKKFKLTETSSVDKGAAGIGGLVIKKKADLIPYMKQADLTGSLKMNAFADAHPERFFQVGVAEANMMGMAAGLTIGGKIPFTGTFANFSTSRVYDQIRQSIAYSDKNVKICASHAGVTLGEDGATHQTLEDIGMMKMLPGMVVINPCDYNQTKAATIAIADYKGPVYLRFGRPSVPIFTPDDQKFEIGKAIQLTEGKDVTIVATGHLVWESLQAAEKLDAMGISVEVINIHTIKPLDKEAILKSIAKTGCIVTAEEHNRIGGLGESVAGMLAQNHPTPQEFVAVNDTFGESGSPAELMKKYGLDADSVLKENRKALYPLKNNVCFLKGS
uniref:Putative transketolase C-terminal section n=1 Tax=Stylophora pistillata TaxID=50429 RepID=A0A2B4R864_STYPI